MRSLLDRILNPQPTVDERITDLKMEVAAVRADAHVEYRLRRDNEHEAGRLRELVGQLQSSNKVLQQARDENSILITKLRDRVFELEARFDWTPKHCDLCDNTTAPAAPKMLDSVVIWCGPKRTAHIYCIARLVEGALAMRRGLPAKVEVEDSPLPDLDT